MKRSEYFDIVRGLAILMIVLGHTNLYAGAFVYLFHMELFFFVSGWFFSVEKYGADPLAWFSKRLATTWPRYMVYGILIALFHNAFFRHGCLPAGSAPYAARDFVRAILSTAVFQNEETLAGPMWFIPLWLAAGLLFASVIALSRKKATVAVALTVLLAALGIYCEAADVHTPFYLDKALLVVPFYLFGLLLRQHCPDFRKYLKIPVAIVLYILSIFLLRMVNRHAIFFDLSAGQTYGLLFYPVVAVGIVHTLCLSEFISKSRVLSQVCALLGKYSFDIMAMHMVLFKVLAVLLRKLYYRDPAMDISVYPSFIDRGNYPLGALYIVFSIACSLAVGLLYERVSDQLNKL